MANERLMRLREKMSEKGIEAYYVPSSDFHDSEYAEDYFGCRRYISGFTGSAGTLVVTQGFAGLWTDGRYFVQAKKELDGQGIELMRMGEEGVPTEEEFIRDRLSADGILGFDGRVVNARTGLKLGAAAAGKAETGTTRKTGSGNAGLAGGIQESRLMTNLDLVGEIWEGRPALRSPDLWILGEEYAGESAESKIGRLREAMAREGATAHVLSSLDDIAWLLNIRKHDENGNFLPLAHALVTADSFKLFIDLENSGAGIPRYLEENGITPLPYGDIYGAVAEMRGEAVLLETGKVNYELYRLVSRNNRIVEKMNPTTSMKARKNAVEAKNMRRAHLKDGVALTKFIYWLKKNVGQMPIRECDAADRLEEFRKEGENYLAPSFATISAYGANAAMCHYSAKRGEDALIQPKGLYLVDSGGQYLEGTTDVTRTIVLGSLSDEERLHYTLVLCGMLRLAGARFLKGCSGQNLDILAREPLWERGLDFDHGTGHGVGFVGTVHERPNGFRWKKVPEREDSCMLEAGMVTSDEPGIYIEGSHGIRIENLLLCRESQKNAYGQFMEFETLTLAPIDTEALDLTVMSPKDLEALNRYHKLVYEKLSPYFEGAGLEWLAGATKEVKP